MFVRFFTSCATAGLLLILPVAIAEAETPLPAPQPFVDDLPQPVHHTPVKKAKVAPKKVTPKKKVVSKKVVSKKVIHKGAVHHTVTKTVAKKKAVVAKHVAKPVHHIKPKSKPVKTAVHSGAHDVKHVSETAEHKVTGVAAKAKNISAVAAASVATATATAAAEVAEHHEAAKKVEAEKAQVAPAAKEEAKKVSSKPKEDDRPVVEEQPSYAYLKTRMVNMRRGPGEEYPIDWVYSRRGLPVKILMRYRDWRKVEDPYGTTGWMKIITLRTGRHFVVTGNLTNEAMPADEQHTREVGGDPIVKSWVNPTVAPAADETVVYKSARNRTPVAYLKPGVVGQLISCEASSSFCDVKVGKYEGSILKSHIWGIENSENLEPAKSGFFR